MVIDIIIISFCFFQFLFYFLSPWFSAKISTGFNSLSFKKKVEWNSRVGSTLHSLVVGALGLYIFFFDEFAVADPLWNDSMLVKVNISIASGYLLSDLVAIICYWNIIGDKSFVLHHCTALYAYFFCLKDGVLGYIANYRLLAELSSPFVNQRWFFEVLKYPKLSMANVINGVLMAVVFFIVRIVSMPPLYAFIYSVFGTEPYRRLGLLIQCSWICSCLVLDVLNIFWMIKITKGCLKVLSLMRQKKATKRLQNGKVD